MTKIWLDPDNSCGYSRAVPIIRSLLVLITTTCLLAALTGIASARHLVDSYCSPTGDYCTGIFREGGRIKFRFSTFSFRSYKLCVKPPREARECKSFKLVRTSGSLYGSKIDFGHVFSSQRNGRYAVSWHSEGFRIGPTLHFSKG